MGKHEKAIGPHVGRNPSVLAKAASFNFLRLPIKKQLTTDTASGKIFHCKHTGALKKPTFRVNIEL